MIKHLLFASILSVTTISLSASEIYAIGGMAIGSSPEACIFYQWTGDVLFHNTSDTAAVVRALNVSNGQPPTGVPIEFVIPPHRTDSLHSGVFFSDPLLVVKFDAPDSVVVESRIEIGTQFCAGPPPIGNPNRGKLSFPTFRSLQPAGVAKVHLGTDLASMSARNNVAVYNAGSVAANAHIEVHRGCDDAIIEARDQQIPAFSVMSVNGLGVATGRDLCGTTAPWVTYVVVVVDQPSLSWVSTLANGKDLSVVYGATSSSP